MDLQEKISLRRKRRLKKRLFVLAILLVGVLIGVVIGFLSGKTIVIIPEYSKDLSYNQEVEDLQNQTADEGTDIAVPSNSSDTENSNGELTPNISKKVIVIDAGHQKVGNSQQEPIAPGSNQTKAKVASGAVGIATKNPEYVVTLDVSLLLKKELLARGYSVIMVRETNDVNISNSERATIANNANADAFIRIHCNGVDNSSVTGALSMCQTAKNPYCGNLYKQSRKLSECVLSGLCGETGAKNRGVSETDTMSGINWCKVPVTIVEMGFMSNPEEDRLMSDKNYQAKLAIGMANGIDEYFK